MYELLQYRLAERALKRLAADQFSFEGEESSAQAMPSWRQRLAGIWRRSASRKIHMPEQDTVSVGTPKHVAGAG